MRHKSKKKRPEWKIIDRVVRGDAGVIVSELPLPVPRYSFKVGTAKIDPDTEEMYVTPYLSVFNSGDAQDLLSEVTDKYTRIREDIKDDMDEKRRRWEKEV